MAGGHTPVSVSDKDVKMVAGRSKTLLAATPRITGPNCNHATLLEVVKASRQVLADSNPYSCYPSLPRWWRAPTSD